MQRDASVSQTEPSTPISSARIERPGSYGPFSTLTDGHGVRLPPYELPQVTARLSKAPPRPMSRSRSKHSSTSNRSTPKSTPRGTPHDTPKDTPRGTPTRINRRASEVIEQRNRRRRRSSMLLTESGEPVYDPTYVGPITIDYLRFWCKVSIKEKEREKVFVQEKQTENTIPVKERIFSSPHPRDYDQSLPIPSDSIGLLQSPFQLEEKFKPRIPESPSFEEYRPSRLLELGPQQDPDLSKIDVSANAEPKVPKTFSYLEKILMSRRSKSQTPLRVQQRERRTPLSEIKITSPPSEQSVPAYEENFAIVNNTEAYKHFVDENHIHAETRALEHTDQSLFTRPLSQSPAWASIHDEHLEDVNLGDIKEYSSYGDQTDPPNFGASTGNRTPERNPQPGISLSSLQFSPSKVITPQNDTSPFQRSNSSNQIIQEEYTFGDGNLSHTFIESPTSNSEQSPILPMPEIRNPIPDIAVFSKHQPKKTHRISSSSQNKSSKMSMPKASVRNLVKSIRYHSLSENVEPAKKKPKRIRSLSQDVYESLHKKSDQFLDSLVSDIHAYANHRTSSDAPKINLSDVLLYLNRVNFVGSKDNREEEIARISNLAQNHLPLELLISLDNSLNAGKISLEEAEQLEDLEESSEGEFIESGDSDVYTD